MITHPDLYFGAIAIKNGFASNSEIELALEAQKDPESSSPPRLGEILAEMGTLTDDQIRTVLEAQAKLREAEDAIAARIDKAGAPDVKFEEIQPAALIQESGPELRVNDELLASPRTLKEGDRLKAGDLLFRFSGESIEIFPKKDLPASDTAPVAKPAEPAVPKPKLSEKLLPVLRKIDGVIARIPPALHTQRKYVLAGSLLGAIAFLLPWRVAGNGNTVLGIQGPGWLNLLLLLVPAACTLFTRPAEPFTKAERIAASGAAGLGVLIGLLKFVLPPSYAVARGVGLYLAVVAAAAVLAAAAFARAAVPGPASDAPTLGMRLWKKLSGVLGSMSGRRAKELGAAMEQKDALLKKIGEAALQAHGALPEAQAAVQAREALQKADQEATSGNVKAKAAQKSADLKAKRAFAKLAQKALDGGLALSGQEATVAELRAVEARIKELS